MDAREPDRKERRLMKPTADPLTTARTVVSLSSAERRILSSCAEFWDIPFLDYVRLLILSGDPFFLSDGRPTGRSNHGRQ